MTLTVRDLMTPDPMTIPSSTTISRAYELLTKHKIRHLPIVDEGRLAGILSDRDLLRLASESLSLRAPVRDVMSWVVHAVAPHLSARDAGRKMREERFSCLVVVEDEQVVGILTESDFVRWIATSDPTD